MVEILTLINKGGFSLRDMAKQLEMEKQALEDRIGSLVRSGYIKEMKFVEECGSKKCRDCPIVSTCAIDKDLAPKVFELTDKGKRALKR